MTDAMIEAVIALATLAVLVAMSRRANDRWADQARLPMHWWIDGSVTWTAPRRVALAFMPVLAGAMMAGLGLTGLVATPRPGQSGVMAFVTTALMCVAIHALHLWLIGQSLKKS